MSDTKMANVTNEVLAAKLDNALSNINELKIRFDGLSGKFVDNRVYELKHAEIQRDIAHIHTKLLTLENRKNLINWITPTVSAIFGSVLTYLIIQQLNRGS